MQHLKRQIRDLYSIVAILGLALLSCLILTGMSLRDAVATTLIVAVQVISGAIIWSLVKRSTQSVYELLGIGAAIGISCSILIGLVFRPTSFSPFSWTILPALVAIGLIVSKLTGKLRFSELETLRKCDVIALILGTAFGIFLLTEYWLATPLNPIDGAKYYVDIPFHEAVGNGIAHFGQSDYVLNAGDSLRYHWFSHAWSGFTQLWTGTSTLFVAQTRALPLISLMILALISIAWTKKLTSQAWAPTAATLMLCAGTSIGLVGPLNFLARSPSHVLGLAFVLASAYLIFEYIFNKACPQTLLVIALLSFATIGAKSSAALPLCVGLVALAIYLLRDRTRLFKTVTVGVVVAISYTAGYAFAISGSDGGMTIDPTSGIYRWGFEGERFPYLAIPLSMILSLVSMLPSLLAIIYGLSSKKIAIRAVSIVAFVSGLAGLVMVSFFSQSGQSQDYFLRAAFPLLVIAAIAAVSDMVESKLFSIRELTIAAISGITIQLLLVLLFQRFNNPNAMPPSFWLATLCVAGILAAVVISARSSLTTRSRAKSTVALLAVFLLAAQFATGVAYVVIAISKYDSKAQGRTVTADELNAANWLTKNTGDARIATNRFCWKPNEDPTDCGSTVFTVAAFSGQRMLLEGYKYVVGPSSNLDPDQLKAIQSSVNFSQSPACDALDFLKEKGVEYLWIDMRYTDRTSWEPYGTVEYSNPTVSIVKLNRQAC